LRSNRADHGGPGGAASADEAGFADAIDRVRGRLGPIGSTFRFFPTIGSTNDVALSLGAEGAVVVADAQTSGRGRRGHVWFSPPGSGLYVSVVLTPGRSPQPARATGLLTIAAGVALADAIDASTGLTPTLKWPNDLFAGRRKLGGILAEAASSGGSLDVVVVGFGINVGPMAYPPALADQATSLEAELGRAVDRAHVFAEALAALAPRYRVLLDGRFDAILDAWRRRAPAAIGTRVSWTDASGVRRGTTAGIDDEGALLVRGPDRMHRIVAGELTWL
jgi:BirA family biotin operon repressor/biotin-[acetyl-CoA-carboxylase] ligase